MKIVSKQKSKYKIRYKNMSKIDVYTFMRRFPCDDATSHENRVNMKLTLKTC